MDYKERLSHFRRIVNSTEEPIIDLDQLATLALRGIPDENSLRPRTWKLLLHLVPSNRAEWETSVYEKRCQYYNFLNELLAEPDPSDSEDHPLNSATTSKWGTYFHDNEILEQIDKDVRRTNPDLAWFQTPVPSSHLSPLSPPMLPLKSKSSFESLRLSSPLLTPTKFPEIKPYPEITVRRSLFRRIAHLNTSFGARERTTSTLGALEGLDETEADLHWEAIERILFIYAKLNPAIGYVQGMNELIAPLYYVLAQDELEENSAHAEADTFHLFTTLMSSLHSIFIRPPVNPPKSSEALSVAQLSHTGMNDTLDRFSARLHAQDPELAHDLDEKGLETTFYAFRWFTCLAPGGLGLPDTIRLWDSLFADWCLEQETNPSEGDEGFHFLEDFGVAVILSHRDELLEGGFSENITLLQRRPVEDLAQALSLAYSLREERVTATLNEENEYSQPPTPSTQSQSNGPFKFGKEEESASPSTFSFRRVGSGTSTQSAPASNAPRWGITFFSKNNSSTQVNTVPKTPPPEVFEEQPKFSPGSWGASLSAATRKFNKLRMTPSSPDSPSSKGGVNLEDRAATPTENRSASPSASTLSTIKESTSKVSAKVSAAVRDSFERRNEIISKVGGWVANTHDTGSARSSITDWEDVSSPTDSVDRANEEIRKLEGEIHRKEKEITPEEYIARIKKRREERGGPKEIKASHNTDIDDPLGAANEV